MSQGLVERQHLQDIGDAIRSKNGSSDTYTPAEMAQAISGIHTADEVVLVQKTVNTNGQYNASDDSADGYSGVRVNVPNTYSASDEGKVVSNGDLVAQTTKQITANGTHDTTTNNSVSVDVPNSYTTSDNGKVVVNQALVTQTSKNINANGTHDTTENNSVVVDVPNSYVAADEGKVVYGGALVAQTSRNVTVNGTYDTTENNEVVVNVPTSGGGSDNVFLWRKGSFYGDPDGSVETSLSGSINGVSGEYVLLIVMHRDTITVNGWDKLIDYLDTANTYTPQGISIFIKQITSTTVFFDIQQNSSVRICACSYVFSRRVNITYVEELLLQDTTYYTYLIKKRDYIHLCVMSNAYAGSATGTIIPETVINSCYDLGTTAKTRFLAFINVNYTDVTLQINSQKGDTDTLNNRMYIFKIQ